eukprot:4182098-Pyramimonas_sp.AAC.1
MILERLSYMAEKASIAEMRQRQSSAQGTDAARMTSCYFKAESALWPSSAQQSALEMACQGGPRKSRASSAATSSTRRTRGASSWP